MKYVCTLICFIIFEGMRAKMKRLWLPIFSTCSVNVALGLPLFLLMRELHFEKPGSLYGKVYDEDGDSYEGFIRWDNDEAYTWELLDGEYRGVEIDVEFAQITEIEKVSSRSCRVTTRSGNTFKLSGSNDVNDENKGIFVTTEDGDEIELDWYDFDKVVFK